MALSWIGAANDDVVLKPWRVVPGPVPPAACMKALAEIESLMAQCLTKEPSERPVADTFMLSPATLAVATSRYRPAAAATTYK